MRFVTSDKIYTINTKSLENHVIVVDGQGKIMDVVPDTDVDVLKVERHEGFICPGFVNTHCHLELSFMKAKIVAKQGLHTFIKEVESLKKPNDAEVIEAIKQADEEMHANGIVAVGDISNTANSFAYKATAKTYYHTFIEIYAFDEIAPMLLLKEGLPCRVN
jgi:cytosine/adenosine deaminase-related metal-dependent hydrolase